MFILKDVDFSKLIKRNLNEKHTLLIEYLDLNGKKQKKHWRNNGKDIYLEGIKEITKARVGYDKAWKDVIKKIKEMLIVKNPSLSLDKQIINKNHREITVIINSYNPDKNDLYNSIQSVLKQVKVKLFLLISTIENDKTIEYINSLNNDKIKLVISSLSQHPGKGPKGIYYQLNKALKEVRTKYVTYFSSNDIMYPNKLYNEIRSIEKKNSIFSFSQFESYYPDKNTSIKFSYSKKDMNFKNLLKSNYINDCATIDISKLDKNIEFNYEKYGNTCYWHLWLKLIYEYGIKCMSYNENVEWKYIRDSNKSQAIARSHDKNKKEIYQNQREFMLSEFNQTISPMSLYNYSEQNELFWWWNKKKIKKSEFVAITVAIMNINNKKHNILPILESLKKQKKINFTWELIIIEENSINKNLVKSYVSALPGCVRIIYKSILSNEVTYYLQQKWNVLQKLSDINSKIFLKLNLDMCPEPLLLHKKFNYYKNILWYNCPSIYDTSKRYQKTFNIESLLNSTSTYQVKKLCSPKYNHRYPRKTQIIFFGFYKDREIKILKNLKQYRNCIIFGGSDTWNQRSISKTNLKYLSEKQNEYNIKFFSISNFINNDLYEYRINYIPIYFSSLKDNNLFNYSEKVKKSYIYIYDLNKDVYNKNLVEEIIKHFGEDLFIRSSKINVEYENMPHLFEKCFLGIRLTEHDGNANIVQELGFCGIKCIHNSFFYNTIPFIKDKSSLINKIENEIKNQNQNNYKLISEIFYKNHKLSNFCISNIDVNANRIVDIILWTDNDPEELFCNCIKSLLFQHLVKTNVIVVSYENDVSNDYIKKYFNNYHNLKYISIKKQKQNDLIIEGLKHLKTDFFCIANVNEFFYSNKINIELQKLEQDSNKIICVSNYEEINNGNLNLINVDLKSDKLKLCNLMRRNIYKILNKNIEDDIFSSILNLKSENYVKINESLFIQSFSS